MIKHISVLMIIVLILVMPFFIIIGGFMLWLTYLKDLIASFRDDLYLQKYAKEAGYDEPTL